MSTTINAVSKYNLTNEEARVIRNWTDTRDNALWPASVPKDVHTLENLIFFVRLMGWEMKEFYLDKALQSFLDFETVKREFPKHCHPNLRNAQGLVAEDNLAKLMYVSFHEFGKKLTVDSLNDATKLLHSRGQLRWETPLPTASELTERNLNNDVARRVRNKTANTVGRKTNELERVHSEADKQAQVKLAALFTSLDGVQKAELSKIIQAHQDANLPWMATLTEASAWQWVQTQLAHPPGANHVAFESVRSSIEEIINDEQDASIRNPASAVALWNRIARRVQAEVLNRHDRSVR